LIFIRMWTKPVFLISRPVYARSSLFIVTAVRSLNITTTRCFWDQQSWRFYDEWGQYELGWEIGWWKICSKVQK
jgi:hypothetical protein